MNLETTRILTPLGLAALIAWTGCAQAPDSDEARVSGEQEVPEVEASEALTVDLDASRIEWIGTKVSSWHFGTIELEGGQLQLKDSELARGRFTIDMTTIQATDDKMDEENNTKLTNHLRSEDFFHVEEHPTATFEITGVKPVGDEWTRPEEPDLRGDELNEYRVTDPTHEIAGNLTIKGITKNIAFPAKIEVGDGGLSARAKFNINRKDWEVNYPGMPDDLIRDMVHLGIDLKASPETM